MRAKWILACLTLALPAHAQEVVPIPVAPPEAPLPINPPCDRSCEGLPCHDDGDVGENCTCQIRVGGRSGGGRRGETMPEDPEDGPPLGIAVLQPGRCMEQGAPGIEFPGPELPPGVDPMPDGSVFWPFLSLERDAGYQRWYFGQRVIMPAVPPHWRELGELLHARR